MAPSQHARRPPPRAGSHPAPARAGGRSRPGRAILPPSDGSPLEVLISSARSSLCLLLLLLLPIASACSYTARPSASAVAASREASARGTSTAPPVHFGLEVHPIGGSEDPAPIGPWVEVRGRVGTAELFEADVVIALDMSVSTNFPSGLDIDEDGVIGETRGVIRGLSQYHPKQDQQGRPPPLPPAQWTTDVDDTVAAMELAAARAIATGLAARHNRIGILSYVERGKVHSEVGSASGALDSLEDVRPTSARTGTNIYEALRRARDMLERAPQLPGFPRQRALLLFTDGLPTAPVDPFIGEIRAREAAADLAAGGIDLYVFRFGRIQRDQAEFLLALAGAGRGRLYRVGAPHRLLEDLPPVDLTPTWLRIENATTEAPARGIETRTDGRFSGFVPLAPGENRVRVLAELGNGKLQRWVGEVFFAPEAAESSAIREATEAVLREIELRERGVDAAAGPPAE